MADNLTTTTQIDPAVSTFYDAVLLRTAYPKLHHEKFAQRRPMPSKSGNTIKFRRYTKRTVATTPLSEGVTPPGQLQAKTDLTATVSFYGDFAHITDVVDFTNEDENLAIASKDNGNQMAETRDVLVRNILAACASSTNAAGGTNGNTPTEITRGDVNAVVMTLLGGEAEFITEILRAGQGVGTSPIRASFWGIMDTTFLDDLEEVSGFTAVSEYSTNDGMDGEWGSTGNVRWLQTTIGYSNGATPNVFSLPIIGKEAYGVTDLDGYAAGNIVKPFGSGGTSDPLNQRATSGWKMGFVARILNDAFMHLLKVTHS